MDDVAGGADVPDAFDAPARVEGSGVDEVRRAARGGC
jgi:hypothetical protein